MKDRKTNLGCIYFLSEVLDCTFSLFKEKMVPSIWSSLFGSGSFEHSGSTSPWSLFCVLLQSYRYCLWRLGPLVIVGKGGACVFLQEGCHMSPKYLQG